MTERQWLREMQDNLAAFMDAHRKIQTTLMARSAAHGDLMTEVVHLLATCLPLDGRTALVEGLYKLADKWQHADQGALSALADADDRINAADIARQASEAIAMMADALVARLRPV